MTGYTKLFNSILTSTIWCQDSDTKVVWITMLAMANPDGIVEATVPGLAKYAGVPVDKVKQVLDMLMSPDPQSRTQSNDGLRVKHVNGGYLLLNYAMYRKQRGIDDRKEYMRKYMRDYMRERRKTGNVKLKLGGANNVRQSLAQAEEEAYKTIPPIIPPSNVNFVKTLIEEQNFKSKIQNPKPRISPPRNCLMPECDKSVDPKYKPFCSQACKDYADFLNSKYGPSA